MTDPFDLARFETAQAPVFETVVAELRNGRKTSHWIWFIFPQIAGLGSSAMAQRYAIASIEEARAYLAHALLGQRLVLCTDLVNARKGRSAYAIFGSPDDMKFRSSMTLFAAAATDPAPFRAALEAFYDGEADASTLARLKAAPEPDARLED